MSDRAPDFEGLYRRHAPNAFRRAWRMLGNSADAHEVVHDVFLSLYERPEQYAGKSSLNTFLYSAITHACLNRLRNGGNRRRLLEETQRIPHPEMLAASPEQAAVLRSVLEQMPEPLAQVSVYYYLDELSHADIARIMGCSSRHVGDLLERVARWAAREESAVCDA
ncbi:MAG TPA: sigma-70 family RNA polymerase sigma factor [Polyangiales bacterium]|nr:sigma-70 family RNA polymerase sigma factor [Polyangiales bacterium]